MRAFSDDPVILTQAQTRNDAAAITTRQRPTTTGFEVRVQEEQAADGIHAEETIGYIAISPGTSLFGDHMLLAGKTPRNVSHNFRSIDVDLPKPGIFSPFFLASMQTFNGGDVAALRYRNLSSSGFDIRVEEEQSADEETLHTNEVVGFVMLQQVLDVTETKLTAFDGAAGDFFGASIDISGDTLVVGAQGDDSARGAAYVFERSPQSPTDWRFVKKLTASDRDVGDTFGETVAIHSNTIVVGALRNDDNGSASGSAYVFERNLGGTNNWGQQRKLLASDSAADDRFGSSVAIQSDTIVIGADFSDDKGINSGSTYIFERNLGGANTWGEQTKLTASDGANNDKFGSSGAIDQDTVVIGSSSTGVGVGSAYIFERNLGGADSWGERTKLTASDGAANDFFGDFLAIEGDTIVIGAAQDDDNGDNSGSAYVFERNLGGEDNWGEQIKLTASDGAANDRFGDSVAIYGDTIVIGSDSDDDKGRASGSAYIFERNNGGANTWGEQIKLTASDGEAGDFFGSSVAIAGSTIVVGAFSNDDKGNASGSAYVFE
jgi:hypothetical protein